jgi:hypothetical protein
MDARHAAIYDRPLPQSGAQLNALHLAVRGRRLHGATIVT